MGKRKREEGNEKPAAKRPLLHQEPSPAGAMPIIQRVAQEQSEMRLINPQLAQILEAEVNLKNGDEVTLDLAKYRGHNQGIWAIAEAIQNNKNLKVLTLQNLYKLNNGSLEAIAIGLKEHKSLTHLGLLGNYIGDKGAEAIAEVLKENSKLERLNLLGNNIGVKGGKAIAKALESNSNIKHLDLTSNKLGDEGAKAIAGVLKKNKSLQHLHLTCNSFGEEGVKIILEALTSNTYLSHLSLDMDKVGAGYMDTEILVRVLENNKTLTDLHLEGYIIGDEGVRVIAKTLEKNASLIDLYLFGNKIGKEEENAINVQLKINADKVKAWIKLANICIERKQYSEAVDAYKKVIHNYEKELDAVRAALIDSFVDSDLGKAAKINDTIKVRSDVLAKFYEILGDTFLKMGQDDEAVDSYKKAIALYPEDQYYPIDQEKAFVQGEGRDSTYLFLFDFDNTIAKGNFHSILKEGGVEYGKADSRQIEGLLREYGIKNPVGLLRCFRTALEHNHKIGIVTFSKYPEVIVPTLLRLGLTEEEIALITIVSGSPEDIDSDPWGYKIDHSLKSMELHNITDRSCVYVIDDDSENCAAVKSFGFNAIHVPLGRSKAYLEEVYKLADPSAPYYASGPGGLVEGQGLEGFPMPFPMLPEGNGDLVLAENVGQILMGDAGDIV